MKSLKKQAPKAVTAFGKSSKKGRGSNVPRLFFRVSIATWFVFGGMWVFATEPIDQPRLLEAYLPDGFPLPHIPPDNPLTAEKIALGRNLFYEKRLAVDGKTSCASCHIQTLAFTDGKPRAVGATGGLHPRATMSLVNAAYSASLTWADPVLKDLEAQALVPLFNQHPVEMGLQGRLEEVLAILKNDASYALLFAKAYPQEEGPDLSQITRALASFQRTIISFSSTFDTIVFEDAHPPQRETILRGFSLFFSEPFNCGKCHGGFNFSGPVSTGDASSFPTFHHNGLLGQGPEQDERRLDPGLAKQTGHPRDWGKFRAPTLRNIALTAPYMHNGSLASLEEVLNHYATGGQANPVKGIPGKNHPNKSPFIGAFTLSDGQRQDLLVFLKSLTDQDLIEREDLKDPNRVGSASE